MYVCASVNADERKTQWQCLHQVLNTMFTTRLLNFLYSHKYITKVKTPCSRLKILHDARKVKHIANLINQPKATWEQNGLLSWSKELKEGGPQTSLNTTFTQDSKGKCCHDKHYMDRKAYINKIETKLAKWGHEQWNGCKIERTFRYCSATSFFKNNC